MNGTDIEFCPADGQAIENGIISAYETASGRKLQISDPVRILLQSLAYVIIQQRVVINETGKQNLLRYALGDKLDAIGELLGVKRIPPSKAVVTVKFVRAEGSMSPVFIRSGTRVTGDSKVYFQTLEDAVISENSSSVELRCEAMTAGILGNEFEAGTINKIVDPAVYLSKAWNITKSNGGRDTESDESLRERIIIAPESFSVAGPILAYKYHAKSADVAISDVTVLSPEAGKVEIYPLLEGGLIPPKEILDKVSAAVTHEKVRPLTDFVEVKAPVQVPYNINIKYYLYENSDVTEATINSAIAGYSLWQGEKLGRDINPDVLRSRLIAVGVKRVELTEPIYKALSVAQVANCESCLAEFGGVENE